MLLRPFSLVVFGVAAIVVATLPRIQSYYSPSAVFLIDVAIALGAGYIVLSYERLHEQNETTNASKDSSQG